MSTPHKHKDLIIAWANGAEIEYRTHNLTPGRNQWEKVTTPSWQPDYEYRIKPQPKKCRVALFKWEFPGYKSTSIEEKDWTKSSALPQFVRWISPVIEYTEE